MTRFAGGRGSQRTTPQNVASAKVGAKSDQRATSSAPVKPQWLGTASCTTATENRSGGAIAAYMLSFSTRIRPSPEVCIETILVLPMSPVGV